MAIKGANLTYNLLGQLATVARTNYFGVGPAPDIATGTFSYDAANRLTKIVYTHNGGTATDAYSWVYDAADRVTSMTTTTDGTANYSYDNTNQVTGAAYTGTGQPANESYTYDANGNRTNTGYSTGTNNQLTSDGTFNYTYDAEGNRATRTRISNAAANDYKTTYAWDYRDRLSDVNYYNNSNVLTKHVHYTYDVFDHLIGKQVDDTGGGTFNRAEFYVYDGSDVALQFSAAGALTERYLQGPSASGVDTVLAEEDVTSLVSPGVVTWPLTDNLGTVRDIVDSTGAVIDHLVFNSFGQLASGPTNVTRFLYTGEEWDADSGLQYNWHRWYDPGEGRWISEDPMGFPAGDLNLSRYVSNHTTGFSDPSGLAPPNPVPATIILEVFIPPSEYIVYFSDGSVLTFYSNLAPLSGMPPVLPYWFQPNIVSSFPVIPIQLNYTNPPFQLPVQIVPGGGSPPNNQGHMEAAVLVTTKPNNYTPAQQEAMMEQQIKDLDDFLNSQKPGKPE